MGFTVFWSTNASCKSCLRLGAVDLVELLSLTQMEPCLTLYATASIVVLLASIITALLGIALYRLYWHPLAGVPGPPWAALSNVWQGIHVRNGRARILGKTLHEQYGPVVRVGPNEVWFNSPEAFRKIYCMDSLFSLRLSFI
jgi:hypothetical protein